MHQSNSSIFLFFTILSIVIVVVLLAASWRIFTKAGKSGWSMIIPIYNTLVFLQIIKRPWWWIFLFLIPFVGIIVTIIAEIDLAKSFGKNALFGVFALTIFPIIGLPILAFGKATYQNNTPPQQPQNSMQPQPQGAAAQQPILPQSSQQ